MSLSPKDVVNEVLLSPSPFRSKAVELLNSIIQNLVAISQKKLQQERQFAQSNEGLVKAKRSAPFIPSEFLPNRDEKLIKDYDSSDNKKRGPGLK